MKKMKKQLCWLLAALLLLSLAACGKEEPKDPNQIILGDYTLLYKGACIMEDIDGREALVLTLDYTNNSKTNDTYLWSVSEIATQKGADLETATVVADYATYDTVISGQMTEVEPGKTLEVQTAFVLNDVTTPVKVRFEEFIGKKYGEIPVDPAALSRNLQGLPRPGGSCQCGYRCAHHRDSHPPGNRRRTAGLVERRLVRLVDHDKLHRKL